MVAALKLVPVVRIVPALALCALLGCDLATAPDEPDGRSPDQDSPIELMIVHGRAETLTVAELSAATGEILGVTENARVLGNIPAGIETGDTDAELLVTLSGENKALVITESSLSLAAEIPFDAGTNPMASLALGSVASVGKDLVATTSLFGNSVIISNRDGRSWVASGDTIPGSSSVPFSLPAATAPQAILALPGSDSSRIRLLVANTAYSASNPSTQPFGEGSLTEYELAISPNASPPSISVTRVNAAYTFGTTDSAGLNPTNLVYLPASGAQGAQILVVGSGRNLGDNTDDGRVLALDALTLAVEEDLAIGGSPGSAVVVPTGSTDRLFLSGPTGIRTIVRDDATGWAAVTASSSLIYETTASLALIASLAWYPGNSGSSLYASNYWEDQLFRFSIGSNGSLTLMQTLNVPQGPQGLLVVDES